ncbi:MAG: PAS domain S-box protein [Methanoregulaceae archaeon]
MADTIIERIQKIPRSIPALIFITSALAIILNFYLLLTNQTVIFDPLFYIPIILVAYFYPRHGVSIAGAFAVLYLLMVMVIPPESQETALSSLGHAGIFIIIGFVVSSLSTRYPQEIHKRLANIVEFSFKKPVFIPILILITSILAFGLNYYLLLAGHALIFDPLFYFPIILVAYFYPQRGVFAATGYSALFVAMVLAVPYTQQGILVTTQGIILTSIGHAGIFIIIGFVVSYLVRTYNQEQEIHKRLAEIVESSSDAIIGKTLEGIITDWNKGAEHLYGYTAKEVIGRSINVLLPPTRADDLPFILKKVQQGVDVERYETERMAKDGKSIWVSLSVSPIKNDAGKIIGAAVIAHDITERKRAEVALERANRKLQLLNSITRHDILNQLTVINIYHNLAENAINNPDALLSLQKAKEAAETIGRQISFTQEYQDIGVKKPTWLNVYVRILNTTALFKNNKIPIEPCDKNIEIYADPLFDEVLYHLIDNSIRYGEKITRIRFTHREDENGLTLIYEDDGIGIPLKDKRNIFNKGFGKDTGLGLFLIREILAITAITITETGEPGEGARFEMEVPKGVFRFKGSTEPS